MSPLKAILKSLDGLSDAVKEFYKKDGEDYRLEVEGMVPKATLDEFRDSNVELKKKNEQMTETLKKYEGVDLEKWKSAQELERQVKDKELMKAGDIDAIVASRMDPYKKQTEDEKKALQKQLDTMASQLEAMQIDDQLTKLGTAKGLRPTAIEDMLLRGRRIFKLKEGKVVALGNDGAQLVDKKSGDPLTMGGWVDQLSTEAPHLFQASGGGGAPSNGTGGGGTNGAKTVKRATFDGWTAQEKHDFTIKEKGQVID